MMPLSGAGCTSDFCSEFDSLLWRQRDVPRHALGDLLPGQPPSSEPIEYDLRCDADGSSGALYSVASIGPSQWVRCSAVNLDSRDPPPRPQEVNHAAGERRSVCRAVSWIIRRARRNEFTATYYTPVQVDGLYWSFLDIVWLTLYPLIYLIGRR